MDQQWTPEPWIVTGNSIVNELSSRGTCIANIEDDGGYEASGDEQKANAQRIVDCVNACAGKTVAEIKRAVECHTVLLAACKMAFYASDPCKNTVGGKGDPDCNCHSCVLSRAIAQAEKETP